MRAALISPYACGPARGNIITVERISRQLSLAGVETMVLSRDLYDDEAMERQLDRFRPSLVHGFHALRCGPAAARLARRYAVPLAVTMTGSDLHDPLQLGHPDSTAVLRQADAVICFSPADQSLLVSERPELSPRVWQVPQGVEALPEGDIGRLALPPDAFVLLLPAALRPVKNIIGAIDGVGPLWERDRRILLVVAGGELDREYAAAVRRRIEGASWAVWPGEVPRRLMGGLYRRADLVLNWSRFEGMSNSLLEAMALGRPVVAADIPGNRSLVRHGENGWLFSSAEEFRQIVQTAAADQDMRIEVGEQGRGLVEQSFSPAVEAERYRHIYEELCRRQNRAGESP